MSAAPGGVSLPVELCLVGDPAADVDDAEGALRALAELAVARGYAHPSYVDAVVERERRFPTGLPLPVAVAIPHTDPHHVVRPALAVLVPPKPLRFGEMGGKDRTVDAELVVMLMIVDPSQQVALLGRLIAMLRADDLREQLVEADDAEQLATRFQRMLDGPGAP